MAGDHIDLHTLINVDITNVGRGYILPGTVGAAMASARATVWLPGLNAALRALDMLPQATRKLAGQAMAAEMALIIQDARQNYAPVDRGSLQRSGSVKGPQFLGISLTRVEGSFGPVQNKYGSNYAVPVHDIPAPPGSSVSGRSAVHPRGQWKYLETPFLKRAPQIPANVQRKVEAGLADAIRNPS